MKKTIEITQEQAKELLKSTPSFTDIIYKNFPELKPKKRWFEEYEGGGYGIMQNIETGLFITDNLFSKLDYKNTFIFKNPQQTQQHAKRLNLYTEMQVFANFRNGDWEVDWNDDTKYKFGVEISSKELKIKAYFVSYFFVFQIGVKSKEIAQEMLEEFGDRIKECFNLK